MFRPVTHVIFDMDGLLINTEDLYTLAYSNICKPYGKVYDWNVKIPCMGKRPDEGAKYVIETLGLPLTINEWHEKFHEQVDELFSQAKLMPGAEKLVNHLSKHNIPIAICSGSSRRAYNVKTSHLQHIFKKFNPTVLCGDDPEVQHSKPHPDPYNVTRRRFDKQPEAEKVLVFEDAPNGILSALAANMQVVMVPDEHIPKEMTEKATLVLKSLEDFIPQKFGLPPY